MRRSLAITTTISAATVAGVAALVYLRPSSEEVRAANWQVLDRYCLGCHNDDDRAGDVSFKGLDRTALHADAEIWEAAVRKLRTGLMPPKGEPRPERAALDALAGSLEQALDAAWQQSPNPGTKPLARLNRTEYANAIRDLLAYEPGAVVSSLPADVSVGGFDNIAAALSTSPTLLEGYALAAMQIGRRAVGDRTMGNSETRYAAAPGAAQQRHIEGQPLGTRGGLLVEHTFPLDAEYELSVQASLPTAGWDNPTGRLVYCNAPSVHVAFNGAPVETSDTRRFRLRVPAGPQRISVALVDEAACAGTNELYKGEVALEGAITGLVIDGPYNATGAGDTPSRRRIFADCHPAAKETGAVSEAHCAEQILTRLATRAYRRPIEPGDAQLDLLLEFYRLGREEGDFEVGVQYALSRMLVDPNFLYRFEREPADVPAGGVYRLSGLELASRLAFFLWSSLPDEELLAAAVDGSLDEPRGLAAQVDRMLADERSMRLVENFAGQWLGLRELDDFPSQDPAFDADLRAAFHSETQLLFADVLRERRGVLTLLDADYTFLNARLAEHYGISGVHGDHMRRVALPPDSPRRGLLGHGSLLTTTSAPNRTSPVVRGQWIVQSVLGAAVPSPPPGAAADLAKDASEAEGLAGDTVRARLEAHRANPSCEACHAMMDPIGLALENFDLVGRWRTTEDGHPIDATTELTDGTPLAGPVDLRRALLARSDAFVQTLAERLLTYALGREVTYEDMPAVRGIVRTAAAAGDVTLDGLIQAIVASVPFQMRVKTGATQAAALPEQARDAAVLARAVAPQTAFE